MTFTSISRLSTGPTARVITRDLLIALALIVTFNAVAMQPAHAQTSDTWKSVAIVGGSTVAGAYIGHKVAGPTGAWIGAGVGASVGYAIDSRRRANEYGQYGSYDPNAGYDPNSGYYGNGPYYPGSYDPSAYPGGLQYRNNYSAKRQSFSRPRGR